MSSQFKPPSNTFCALPWIHLSTRPDGSMRVCCTANASSVGPTNDREHGGMVGILKTEDGKPANLNNSDLMGSWNNSYMRNVRKQMLAGEKPPSCLKCYREEASGLMSKRQWETAYWAKRVDIQKLVDETSEDGEVAPQISYIDLRLGSKCNLACIMCSPHDSSKWVPDWNKLHPQIQNPALKQTMNWDNKGRTFGGSYNWHKNNPVFWEQLFEQIPNMRQLYFAGGEATIIEEHYTLLEEVIRRGYAKNIELRYNSNGVEMPDRLFDLWDQFKNVRFHYSIDSFGAMNDYIRYPSKWDHQVGQFWKLDSTGDNVEVTIACAFQVLNVFYIPDLIKWKLEQGFKKINTWPAGAGLINLHGVYHPPHLNVKVLPVEFKEQCEQKYESFFTWLKENYRSDDDFVHHPYGIKRLRGVISFMKSEDWSNRMPEFREYIKLLDSIRGTDFSTTFPEMAHLLEE